MLSGLIQDPNMYRRASRQSGKPSRRGIAFLAMLAIGMAMVIGVGFGVYPASRAACLAPIDALRSE